MEIYFKVAVGILYVCFGYIRYTYQKKYKQNQETILFRKYFKREKCLVLLVGIVFNCTYLLYWFTPLFSWATVLSLLVRAFGLIIATYGLYLFWLTHKTLGENWSPLLEVRKEHQLITTGIYKHIRHPMYTSIFILVIGLGMLSGNILVVMLPLVMFYILYHMRVKDEEGMMVSWFGDEYILYKRRMGALLPKLRK